MILHVHNGELYTKEESVPGLDHLRHNPLIRVSNAPVTFAELDIRDGSDGKQAVACKIEAVILPDNWPTGPVFCGVPAVEFLVRAVGLFRAEAMKLRAEGDADGSRAALEDAAEVDAAIGVIENGKNRGKYSAEQLAEVEKGD